MKKKADLELRLTNMKKTLEAEEDYTTMTVLCYLKVNQEKYLIVPQKLGQMLYSCLMVHIVVIMMLLCMLYAININEEGEYTPNISHNFAVWLVKFPCSVALHFLLYPEVANGMAIMKFCNN